MVPGPAVSENVSITGPANLYYHLADFQNIIGLLRNESPLYLLYSASGSENGIKTTQELIGEGEALVADSGVGRIGKR